MAKQKESTIDDLTFDTANARKHGEKNKKAIADSMKQFGAGRSILADADGVIRAGNGTAEAWKQSGGKIRVVESDGKELIVVKRTDLRGADAMAYAIADNRAGELADWDDDVLSSQLDLLSNDFDLSKLGFEKDDLESLLPEKGSEGLTDEDAVPPTPETTVTVEGDVWLLGRHRLMCGDSTSVASVEKLMDGTEPDMIHTDPPYGMNAVSKSAVLTKSYGTDIMGDDNQDTAKDAFRLINNLYPNAKQIWWGANYYCSVLPDSECWLVWDKNNGQSDQTDCELAWANFRSVVRQFTQSSEKVDRVHPTQKPVSLMEWIIKRFRMSCETIADYFGGSGSTLIAAEKHGLKGFIMEYDPKFCDVIIKRWEEYTGKKAELIK